MDHLSSLTCIPVVVVHKVVDRARHIPVVAETSLSYLMRIGDTLRNLLLLQLVSQGGDGLQETLTLRVQSLLLTLYHLFLSLFPINRDF